MKVKSAIFAVLVAFFVLTTSSSSLAVSTREVDEVRSKGVLDSQDKKIIDDFLAEAVQELVRTRDFASVARIRTVILSRQGTQGQYAQQFSESALTHIKAGFQQAESLRPDERKTKVIINLLILIDGLADPALANLAMVMVNNGNMIVRYWAVHYLTNPAMLQRLNSGAASNSASPAIIAELLKGIVDTSSPEVIALMARFAAGANVPQAEELLLKIADMRIERYAKWTVKYELLDIAILKSLESKIPLASESVGAPAPATSGGKAALARRFAQLYSYAIQRYVKGRGILNDTQKQHLVSVMVEVEEKCIGRLLARPQVTIRRALERVSMTALLDEHNRLLGDGTTTGQLPSALGFDYSTDAAGPKRAAPLLLPDPPAKPLTQ